MRLVLVRHGETQRNREGRVLGRGAQRLTDVGRGQAAAVARALRRENIAALYSSPLNRAWETAEAIGSELGLPVQVAEDLAEVDAGELDGLTSEEMRARHPSFMTLWDHDPGSAQMPGGESLTQVQERAWQWVQGMVEKYPQDGVVAVSHNFPIETLVCKVLGVPLAAFRHLRVDLGSISAVELQEGRSHLVLLNDTCHMDITMDRGNNSEKRV